MIHDEYMQMDMNLTRKTKIEIEKIKFNQTTQNKTTNKEKHISDTKTHINHKQRQSINNH